MTEDVPRRHGAALLVVTEPRILQQLPERGVEIEQPPLDEPQRRVGDDGLRERRRLEHRLGGDGLSGIATLHAQPRVPDHVAVGHDGEGKAGHVALGDERFQRLISRRGLGRQGHRKRPDHRQPDPSTHGEAPAARASALHQASSCCRSTVCRMPPLR